MHFYTVCHPQCRHNLTDITELSKLKNINTLSIAKNQNIVGTLANESITNLNVTACNLDNSFDFSKMPNLWWLNISENPNITDIEQVIDNMKNICIYIDEIDINTYEKIKSNSDDKYRYISYDFLNIDYELPAGDNIIDLSKYKLLKKEIMQSIKTPINLQNGYISKKGYIINIIDTTKDSAQIKLGYSDEIIRINFIHETANLE